MGLVDRLDEIKALFDPASRGRVASLLARLARRRFTDAASLIRFHEILLFLRAYPGDARILRQAGEILDSFAGRVERLRRAGADLSPFEEPEVSGVAGTSFSAFFTHPIARHLARRHPREVEIDWERFEVQDRIGILLPPLFPLLEDDALVEAHVPYQQWFRAARGRRGTDLGWLVERVESGRIYDALGVPIHWELGDSPATRTRTRLPVRKVFYHKTPLIRRGEVTIENEMAGPPFELERISTPRGEAILNLTRDTSAVRYRELYGFSHGDPAGVFRCRFGRGVEVYFFGVPPPRRLPLRAYHAGMFFKNGVPVGYVETLSLAERCEVGFNLYYTFRAGETAWLYARLLHLLHQTLGATCFSVDPYQIGHENDEAIDSGAFWFYRKLGFRPVVPEIVRLMVLEERRIRATPGYRTPARTLRRMARGHMLFEMAGTAHGDWDRFHVRNLGLAVQRRGAAGGEGLALVASLIPGLEKAALDKILRAKRGPDEARYLRVMQANQRLRRGIIRLGSSSPA